MATQWLQAHLDSPLGLFFISSLRLHSRARRHCQGPWPNLSLSLACLFSFNRINHPMFAFIATIQLQISLSALSHSF